MYRQLCVAIFCIIYSSGLLAQRAKKTEKEIRRLEQEVVTAVLKADTVSLKKLWAPEFLLNNSGNKMVGNRDSVLLTQKAGAMDYSNFERFVERVQIQKGLVITMGYEVFISRVDLPEANADEAYRCRFTNIWMKKKGRWQQIARHVSIICQ